MQEDFASNYAHF